MAVRCGRHTVPGGVAAAKTLFVRPKRSLPMNDAPTQVPESELPNLPRFGSVLAAVLVFELLVGVGLIIVAGREASAQIGNAFGIVGSLATGLAFAVLLYAILHQQHQLSLQRAQLRATQAELVSHREALYAQNRTLANEAFESSFFRLLEFNRHAANTMTGRFAGPNSDWYRGLDAFRQASNELLYRARMDFEPPLTPQQAQQHLAQAYEAVCLKADSDFGHFFRNLYHLLRFIAERAQANADYYARLVRAQLSTAELVLLFFNCQHPRGTGLMPYLPRYQLLAGMQFPDELGKYRTLVDPSAFGPDRSV